MLGPYKAGLPYDFDQVRVFTWNVKKHRYETGFRDKNIEGYLPVKIKTATDPTANLAATTPAPTFTYRVLADEAGAGGSRSGDRSHRAGEDHPEDLPARRQFCAACDSAGDANGWRGPSASMRPRRRPRPRRKRSGRTFAVGVSGVEAGDGFDYHRLLLIFAQLRIHGQREHFVGGRFADGEVASL